MNKNNKTRHNHTTGSLIPLTGEDGWAWHDVVGDLRVVDADGDTSISSLVGTWKTDSWWVGRTASSNPDLSTAHVELSTWVASSSVESNDLTAEEVVSRWDAGWDPVGVFAFVGNELVNTPDLTGQSVLVDLEPLQACWVRGRSGIWNLREVCDDWTLVRWVDGLGGSVTVMPFKGNGRSSGNRQNRAFWCTSINIASKVGAGDVHDWAVAWWGTDDSRVVVDVLECSVSVDHGGRRGKEGENGSD